MTTIKTKSFLFQYQDILDKTAKGNIWDPTNLTVHQGIGLFYALFSSGVYTILVMLLCVMASPKCMYINMHAYKRT